MAEIQWHSAGMAEVPVDDSWMEPALAARLEGMRYAKRRDEAMLGRWTAKTTVARALGLPLDLASIAGVRIVNAPDGAPEVAVDGEALDLVIGMTDRGDWAVCTVLGGRARVGCDLELVEPRSAAFVADYFTPRERQLHAGVDQGERDLAANLIWSAKESALKVLRTGLRRDTRTVEVDVEAIDGEPGKWHELAVRSAEGGVFPGWWIRFGEFVLTAVAAVGTSRPVSLVEPPPLATAVPSHAWMDSPLTEQAGSGSD
jgi:4'-phosphopantetheinyl transferase